MDFYKKLAIWSFIVACISAGLSLATICMSIKLQEDQWKRDELEIRRDVLRRLFAYRYRLTEALKGKDGEPFIALNEAWIVYADFPKVRKALTKMNEKGKGNNLCSNMVEVVRAMATAANLPTQNLDDRIICSPFTPPSK